MPKFNYYIGIDEVGRGPLAGPVTLCAAVFPKRRLSCFDGIKDSKKLTEGKREEWLKKIDEEREGGRIFYAISSSSNKFIDKHGIVCAIKMAIKDCLEKLNLSPEKCFVLLDGSLSAPPEYVFQETIIKGDEKEQIIAVASVAAKVDRDHFMVGCADKFPEYHFDEHKGYGTKNHYEAIKKHGLCELHRRSYLKDFCGLV